MKKLLSFGLSLILSTGLAGVAGASGALSTDTRGFEVRSPGLPPTCAWPAVATPRAIILCIHGLGLHMGSYRQLGETLAPRGIGVYAIDVRGFGSWYFSGDPSLNFDAAIADIGKTIEYIRRKYPGVPLYLLGESMGGAIALQAAAEYQDQLAGLICSVPSGDRHKEVGADMHVGLHVLAGGFNQRFNAGSLVVSYATNDPQHKAMWENDPRSRKMYSPAELLTFQRFMNRNSAKAHTLKTLPVLLIQGTKDRLVLGSGTWDVYDEILSPNKKFALSMAAEHLIYENGQCSPEDLQYTLDWIEQVQTGKQTATFRPPDAPPAVQSGLAQLPPAAVPSSTPQLVRRDSDLSYWIELKRDGKTYRCNNKMEFKTGDEIRFHVSAAASGYAYIFMKQGSSGARAMLFPDQTTGTDNALAANADCAIPTRTYLKFDNNPGTEHLSLVFSQKPINIDQVIQDPNTVMAFVSADKSGSKDIVPTRMQISWSDATPVLMPALPSSGTLAGGPSTAGSIVQVACRNPRDVLSLEIALEHKQ